MVWEKSRDEIVIVSEASNCNTHRDETGQSRRSIVITGGKSWLYRI